MLLRWPLGYLIFKKVIASFPLLEYNSYSDFGNLDSAKVISESVAEENHLYPYKKHFLAEDSSKANVSVPADTSEPPFFSVIHYPDVQKFWGSSEIKCSHAS